MQLLILSIVSIVFVKQILEMENTQLGMVPSTHCPSSKKRDLVLHRLFMALFILFVFTHKVLFSGMIHFKWLLL